MKRIALVVAVLALVYCSSDPTAPLGPVQFGLLSGDGQLVEAGRDSLLEPVVGRAVRGANGQVSFIVGASPLHAQGVGTGVANVRTCATPANTPGLKPWVDCLDTDDQGFVDYWFEPPTEAGEHCAEIRAIIDGQPEVVAETCSVVEAGPVFLLEVTTAINLDFDEAYFFGTESGAPLRDEYQNAIPYELMADGPFVAVESDREEGRWGVGMRDGASFGETGTLSFVRDGEVVHAETFEFVEGQVPDTWGFLRVR